MSFATRLMAEKSGFSFCADTVAKVGEGSFARNIRIDARSRLNQCCLSAPDLESILLTQTPQNTFATISANSRREQVQHGTLSESASAVLRLITSLNSVGCSIGRLPGLAPLKILS